jgi:hypothetical protein
VRNGRRDGGLDGRMGGVIDRSIISICSLCLHCGGASCAFIYLGRKAVVQL